jgi:hypothetical protein
MFSFDVIIFQGQQMLSFLKAWMLSFSGVENVIIFHGDNVIIFDVLDDIIYIIILGCYHLCYHLMLKFFTISKCYRFYVIIFPCTYFVISFMLSFDVIIFHGLQMLSFLCYHFPLYIFCVIIYVII